MTRKRFAAALMAALFIFSLSNAGVLLQPALAAAPDFVAKPGAVVTVTIPTPATDDDFKPASAADNETYEWSRVPESACTLGSPSAASVKATLASDATGLITVTYTVSSEAYIDEDDIEVPAAVLRSKTWDIQVGNPISGLGIKYNGIQVKGIEIANVPGVTYQLEPVFNPADTPVTDVTWTVTKGDDLISVSAAGVLEYIFDDTSGETPGTSAEVTLKAYGNMTTTLNVIIKKLPDSLNFKAPYENNGTAYAATGKSLILGVVVTIPAGQQASQYLSKPAWSSSDTAIATVDSTGRVTGVAAGITTVKATLGDLPPISITVKVGNLPTSSLIVPAATVVDSNTREVKTYSLIGDADIDAANVLIKNAKALTKAASDFAMALDNPKTNISSAKSKLSGVNGKLSALIKGAAPSDKNPFSADLFDPVSGRFETISTSVNALSAAIALGTTIDGLKPAAAQLKDDCISLSSLDGASGAAANLLADTIAAKDVKISSGAYMTSIKAVYGALKTGGAITYPDDCKWTTTTPNIIKLETDSSDPKVCKIIALAKGAGKLSFVSNGITLDTISVNVKVEPMVIKLNTKLVNNTLLMLAPMSGLTSKPASLSVSIAPSSTIKTIVWSSSNSPVASVDSKGKVSAVSAGTANITAEAVNGVKLVVPVEVISYGSTMPKKVVLDKTVMNVSMDDDSAPLVPKAQIPDPMNKGKFIDISVGSNYFVWSSGKESIAGVDQNGVVTGRNAGTATITCMLKGTTIKATCKVTVLSKNINKFQFEKSQYSGAVGTGIPVKLVVLPENRVDTTITWSVSPAAELESAGGMNLIDNKITAASPGTYTVTAKSSSGNWSASCAVTVK